MADTNDDQQAADRITTALRGHVQGEFPYMKTEAVTRLVMKWHEDLKKGILEQRPQMAASEAHFNFFSLSAELRNEIYSLAMIPDPDDPEDQKMYRWDAGKPVLVIQSDLAESYGYDPDRDTEWWSQPTITKVSRQIRKETLPIFYGNVVFRVYGFGVTDHLEAADRRFRQLRPYLHWIKHVHVLHVDELVDDLKSCTIEYFSDTLPPSSMTVMVESRRGEEDGTETVPGYIEL